MAFFLLLVAAVTCKSAKAVPPDVPSHVINNTYCGPSCASYAYVGSFAFGASLSDLGSSSALSYDVFGVDLPGFDCSYFSVLDCHVVFFYLTQPQADVTEWTSSLLPTHERRPFGRTAAWRHAELCLHLYAPLCFILDMLVAS